MPAPSLTANAWFHDGTGTCALSNPNVGDILVFTLSFFETTPAISDSNSNTWIQIYSDSNVVVWYAVANSNGSWTMTYSPAEEGSTFPAFVTYNCFSNASSVAVTTNFGSQSNPDLVEGQESVPNVVVIPTSNGDVSIGFTSTSPQDFAENIPQYTSGLFPGEIVVCVVTGSEGPPVITVIFVAEVGSSYGWDYTIGNPIPVGNGWCPLSPWKEAGPQCPGIGEWVYVNNPSTFTLPNCLTCAAPIDCEELMITCAEGNVGSSVTTFDEVEFPVNVSFKAVGGPMFSTIVTKGFSGQEYRNRNWANCQRKWTISLKTPGPSDANAPPTRQIFIDQLNAFFLTVSGMGDPFRFKDWTDWRWTTPQTLQTITATTFQLVKNYVCAGRFYTRTITKPVWSTALNYLNQPLANSVQIAVGGTPTGSFTLDATTGIVTFGSAPGGAVTSPYGEFHVPVRFDMDELPMQLEESDTLDSNGIISLNSIRVIEVLPPNY
jgi:uncharacterized protein (TIGR02217 family)